MSSTPTTVLHMESAVRERYTEGAKRVEADLCCANSYDPRLLEAIPAEILERDYGCGDPTRYLRPGETVLDLGSGSGKLCYIASQVVGPAGRVIGVDMNDHMLALARRHRSEVASRIGHDNVIFLKRRIQDLALDLDALEARLRQRPIVTIEGLRAFEAEVDRMRRDAPLVPDASVDVVISSCVLNLVAVEEKERLFREIHRVLRLGGRAVISDIVSDEDIPEDMQRDPDLWSGCISGAFREDRFLGAFEQAGFYGIAIAERGERPWRTVRGIEFRSMTVVAYKGKEGPCWDLKQAVIYRGPFRRVEDDDGHVYERGVRTAVCGKTFAIAMDEPYRGLFEPVEPLTPVDPALAAPFPCAKGALRRDPSETKGQAYDRTTEAPADCCDPASGCG